MTCSEEESTLGVFISFTFSFQDVCFSVYMNVFGCTYSFCVSYVYLHCLKQYFFHLNYLYNRTIVHEESICIVVYMR